MNVFFSSLETVVKENSTNMAKLDITEEILEDAAEILVLGTTCECVAVTHYNGKPVGDGRPGPIADRLRHLLHDALVTGGVPFLE